MHSIMISKLLGKKVFFDFDGVLATIQATPSKVFVENNEYVKMHIRGDNVYCATRAPKVLKRVIDSMNPEDVYLLSMVATSFEANNKRKFITDNYPKFKQENMIFVGGNEYKSIVIEEMYKSEAFGRIRRKDIVLVEDTSEIIISVEALGFTCYHVSTFFD